MDVGEVATKTLIELGVKMVFGIPGTHIYHIFRSIEDSGEINSIINRHEMASVFMAEAYARISGEPGVAIVTAGPGLTNALTGMGQAFTTSSPVLLISGEVPYENRYDFHGVDETHILEWISYPLCKSSLTITQPDETEEIVKKGYVCSGFGRKGPVHISIPRDLLGKKASYKGLDIKIGGRNNGKISKLLNEYIVGRIAVVLGDEGWYKDSIDMVEKALTQLGSPFISSMVSLGAIPQSNKYFCGYYEKHFAIYKPAKKILGEADTVLMIGVRPDSIDADAIRRYSTRAENLIYILPSQRVRGAIDDLIEDRDTLITITRGNDINEVIVYSSGYSILQDIIDMGIASREFETEYKAMMEEMDREVVDEVLSNSNRKPIHMGYALYILREYIDEGSVITADVGGNESWARDIIGVQTDVRYLYASGFGSLGYSFPASLGAKATGIDNNVISITGDGSLLMSLMELNTMSYYNIPVKVFVFNDSSYGILGYLSKRDFNREIETYIGAVDFSKVAEGMGVESVHVEEPNELNDIVKDVIRRKKPILVDIVVSRMDIPPLWRL